MAALRPAPDTPTLGGSLPVHAFNNRHLATQVQILARPAAADAIAQACFAETTALGLRIGETRWRALVREAVSAGGVRVKIAERPCGERTAKAESEDLAQVAGGRSARDRVRRAAEDAALDGKGSHGKRRGN